VSCWQLGLHLKQQLLAAVWQSLLQRHLHHPRLEGLSWVHWQVLLLRRVVLGWRESLLLMLAACCSDP
jgi:hypothetical protein